MQLTIKSPSKYVQLKSYNLYFHFQKFFNTLEAYVIFTFFYKIIFRKAIISNILFSSFDNLTRLKKFQRWWWCFSAKYQLLPKTFHFLWSWHLPNKCQFFVSLANNSPDICLKLCNYPLSIWIIHLLNIIFSNVQTFWL